jgi:hypothetical protein
MVRFCGSRSDTNNSPAYRPIDIKSTQYYDNSRAGFEFMNWLHSVYCRYYVERDKYIESVFRDVFKNSQTVTGSMEQKTTIK